MKKTHLPIAAMLLAGIFSTASQAQDRDSYSLDISGVDLTINVLRHPVFPQALIEEGYSEGVVKIVFEVDYAGELRDWLVTEATHPDFVESVAKVIDSWRFSPPHVNGENRSIVSRMRIDYKSSGNVLSFDLPSGLLTRRHNEIVGYRANELKLASVRELDAVPRPLRKIKPIVPAEVIEKHDGSRAMFTFFVDETGKVRIPALQEVDGSPEPGMLLAAQDALSQWSFEPPTRKSQPVSVKLSQSFVFTSR